MFPRRRKERRAQYRVRASQPGQLEARVQPASGAGFHAEVLDTSARGARLRADRRPPAIGTAVTVTFVEVAVGKPLEVPAQVVAVGEGTVLRVQFTAVEAFYAKLTPDLWRLFNRRRDPRTSWPAGQGPKAAVGVGERVIPLAVTDLSVAGIGLHVPEEQVAALEPAEELRLALQLPGEEQPLMLVTSVRHRTPFGLGVRHGVGIDRKQSPDFERQEARILAYQAQA